MNIRQDLLNLIETLSDDQLQLLIPLVLAVREQGVPSSEASAAYQAWVSADNDVYDEIFADELATR
jgi:hypothetical protein